MRAARLEQDRVAGVGEHRHQRQHIFLQERLAAGDLDQRATVRRDRIDDFGQRLFLALVKGVFGIAIGAAQIAESQPHEDTRPTRPGALALDGAIDLVNRQRWLTHAEM